MHSMHSMHSINSINNINPMNFNNHMNPINPVPMAPVQMQFGPPVYAPYQPDIIKKYNINLSTGDLGNIEHIYEDMIPKNNSNHPDRYATIFERLNIANYYGSIFNKHYYNYKEIVDKIKNTDIIKNNSSLSNLLGNIRINNFNLYYNKSGNILQNLASAPANFIMFNVCFPIEYNESKINCKENSLNGNIRIYNLLKTDKNKEKALNKIFTELMYYKKIEEIIKNKKCPNFVSSYGNIIAPCNIDFNNINKIKNLENLSTIYNESGSNNTNSLLILTEGINSNILEWSSKKYTKGDEIFVSKVISTGVRSLETWKSVIFQLLVGIYTLHINKIGFKNFSLKDNVYIKKINITPPTIKYWKYVIDNVEYFVPNHGFLVMIDTNFIDNNDIIINNEKKDYFKEDEKYDYDYEIDIIKIINNLFNFDNIPTDIQKIFDNIKKYTKDKDIKKIINNNFYEYLYDKIGYIIPESELNEYKLNEYDKNFQIGDLVLYKKFSKVYIISSYSDKGTILTNNSSLREYNESNIHLEEVKVSDDLITKFTYKSNKDIIETYYIS